MAVSIHTSRTGSSAYQVISFSLVDLWSAISWNIAANPIFNGLHEALVRIGPFELVTRSDLDLTPTAVRKVSVGPQIMIPSSSWLYGHKVTKSAAYKKAYPDLDRQRYEQNRRLVSGLLDNAFALEIGIGDDEGAEKTGAIIQRAQKMEGMDGPIILICNDLLRENIEIAKNVMCEIYKFQRRLFQPASGNIYEDPTWNDIGKIIDRKSGKSPDRWPLVGIIQGPWLFHNTQKTPEQDQAGYILQKFFALPTDRKILLTAKDYETDPQVLGERYNTTEALQFVFAGVFSHFYDQKRPFAATQSEITVRIRQQSEEYTGIQYVVLDHSNKTRIEVETIHRTSKDAHKKELGDMNIEDVYLFDEPQGSKYHISCLSPSSQARWWESKLERLQM